ncbi:hypothetical protein LMG28140_03877 [Paraburkholderia metrosideri]|uniref:Uncharacterized protein n=1 Tax=Paraburkholderia metrosideri TaxID=580937 RepID=A0ABN7HZW9_9BURK|nr:hypothetical protein LMG28140_03877 [Paraburkholderia metrosideri]
MSAWLKHQRLSNLVGVLFQPCTTFNGGVKVIDRLLTEERKSQSDRKVIPLSNVSEAS